MNLSWISANLWAFALQSALLLAVGLALPWFLRLRQPRVCLPYWQGLMALLVLVPLLQPWKEARAGGTVSTSVYLLERIFSDSTEIAGIDFNLTTLTMIICVVAGLRLLWMAVGASTLLVIRRGAVPLDPDHESVAAVMDRLKVEARFLVTPRVAVPVTYGWRRPVVLVPPSFMDLSRAEQAGIACHELLHVRRRDWIFALCESLTRAVMWFHPPVLMLLSRISVAREQVVDGEVVRITGRRKAYMEALRNMAMSGNGVVASFALPFHGRGSLRSRMALLTREVSMTRLRIALTVASLVVAVSATAVLAAAVFPMTEQPEPAAPPPPPPEVLVTATTTPPPSPVPPPPKKMPKNTIAVMVTADGQILVNDKNIPFEDLEKYFRELLAKKSGDGQVALKVGTSENSELSEKVMQVLKKVLKDHKTETQGPITQAK